MFQILGFLLLSPFTIVSLVMLAHRQRAAGWTFLLSSLIGYLLVLFPESSTSVAKALGVGRGLDLLFFILSVMTMTAIAVLYLKLNSQRNRLIEMARILSLLEARLAETDPRPERGQSPAGERLND
jgi:hypothetical protein